MADFSFLSDTDDEAVDKILAEARDHVMLEQVAAINLSGISDSELPSHLENRFSRLKTFPSSSSSSPSSSAAAAAACNQKPQITSAKTIPSKKPDTERIIGDSNSTSKFETYADVGRNMLEDYPNVKSGSKNRKSRCKRVPSSPSASSDESSSLENKTPSSSSSKRREKKEPDDDRKGRRRGFESGGGSGSARRSQGLSISPSPPKMTGCLWCSPKKLTSKSRSRSGSKSKLDDDEFDWEFTDEVLKDMNSFSFKDQKKILRKAVEEQKKISIEAEKIVKLARQASARMGTRDLHEDDGFSD